MKELTDRQLKLIAYEKSQRLQMLVYRDKLKVWCDQSPPEASCHKMLESVEDALVKNAAIIALEEEA